MSQHGCSSTCSLLETFTASCCSVLDYPLNDTANPTTTTTTPTHKQGTGTGTGHTNYFFLSTDSNLNLSRNRAKWTIRKINAKGNQPWTSNSHSSAVLSCLWKPQQGNGGGRNVWTKQSLFAYCIVHATAPCPIWARLPRVALWMIGSGLPGIAVSQTHFLWSSAHVLLVVFHFDCHRKKNAGSLKALHLPFDFGEELAETFGNDCGSHSTAQMTTNWRTLKESHCNLHCNVGVWLVWECIEKNSKSI